MATKKRRKQTNSRKSKAAKRKPAKKATSIKNPVRKKNSAKVRPKSSLKTTSAPKKSRRVRGKRQQVDSVVFEPKGLGPGSAGQSGDLQGLSNRGRSNSESVDELLEEGNAFEAEAVEGVEDALDADQAEVRTHEVPEDDVPNEYLEKDE